MVDHEWARKNNLPASQGDSLDGKAIYVVAAYHHLHCLVSYISLILKII